MHHLPPPVVWGKAGGIRALRKDADFQKAPIADSFKRAAAQEREDNLTRSTSSDRLNDFDGETTFMYVLSAAAPRLLSLTVLQDNRHILHRQPAHHIFQSLRKETANPAADPRYSSPNSWRRPWKRRRRKGNTPGRQHKRQRDWRASRQGAGLCQIVLLQLITTIFPVPFS
jgi:hypothetical protein